MKKSLWLLPLLLLLAACGTLEVGVEQTPTPDHAATATVSALATENARLATQVATLAVPTSTPTPSLGKLAYVQGSDIWVKTLPDGEPQRLTTDGRNSEPRWSPSGEWLAFHKDVQVWLIRADGSDLHPIDQCGPVSVFAWSPVEDRLAYVAGSGILRLEVINADGSDPATLIPLSICAAGILGRIAWSPNGRWIAYGWREELTYQGLWKISADGEERSELYASGVPKKGEAILAGWSPDGQHILFWQGDVLSASMLADGVALYSLPAGRDGPTKLVDTVLVHDDFLAPAPQGDRLAVTAGGYRATWTNKRIAVVEVDGGEPTWLTDESVAAFSPAWSPDGIHLAYVAMPDEGDLVGGDDARLGMMERRIWVVNAQGKPQLQQLTDDPTYRDERPLWSADGSHLLFARMDAEGQASLWLIPAAGGESRRVMDELTPLPGPASGWFGYYGHVDWDQLFDWWRGPAAQELSLPHRDQLSAEILDALAAYQPVMDAQPTVTVLLSNIARWLDAGGKPSDLVRALNEASDRTEDAITATELDLTADGRDDVVVRIPIMGLPLLVFLNTKGPPAHFEGYALPPDLETIQTDWPAELTAYELEQPALQLTDLTGDDVPEVLFNSVSVGGSNFRLRPRIFQWHEGDFRLIFAAELVSWVGYSTLSLEANPVGGQDIVLHYPHLYYPTGFEAKLIAHPWATQRWRWDPTQEQYTLHETTRDLDFESNLPDREWEEDALQKREWEWMRVLVNEAELHYQAGSLEKALASYQSVLSYGASLKRPEGRTVHWPAYARFRIAQVQALLGQADAARAELNRLLADLDEESNLRPLVQAFDETYDPAQPDAALRAMAALHGLNLYEQFCQHGDRPGDLTFPMNMLTLLWPGTPLARYLDAHPEAVDGPPSSEREQALLHTLSELGFPVTGVRIADLNADGLNEVLVTTDETDQTNGRLLVWLLAQTRGHWHSYRWPNTDYSLIEEVIEEPLPDGRVILQWRDPTATWAKRESTFAWTGDALVEVDPETYEPLPPGWPVVGWPDS
jgi:Tol biopolymer transport system component/ribosomal protein S16/tetratricopeptide (TPR) repeat protein